MECHAASFAGEWDSRDPEQPPFPITGRRPNRKIGFDFAFDETLDGDVAIRKPHGLDLRTENPGAKNECKRNS